MSYPEAFDRRLALGRLDSEQFDVLVIGGGITGAGVALDAANRGLTTALVERSDFASGTSSKSSKLIHGGLRYLQQGELRLVYEALAERQIVLKMAPHLVEVMPFMIPMFSRNGLLNPKLARALGLAMWQYDLTGGMRIGKRHSRLSKTQALAHMPSLDADNLDSAYIYYDAHADDARLTLEIIRTAVVRYGAVAANRCAVVGVDKTLDGKVKGATISVDGSEIQVAAKCVVNATGVWSDGIRTLDDSSARSTIRPAKGVHIAVPRSRCQTDVATVMPVPGDRRSVFVVPWGEVTYIGTTDTDYAASLDEATCTSDDVAYLLSAVNHSTNNALTTADVVGTWAGLRPLVTGDAAGRTADLSRRHSIVVADSGTITVTGGKLTTFRRMAEDTVDIVVSQLGLKRRCRTASIKLAASKVPSDLVANKGEGHLYRRYGANARVLDAMIEMNPDLGLPMVEGLPYVMAEAVYAAKHEMANTLDDVLTRRTRARLLDVAKTSAAAQSVAELIAPELGWDTGRLATEVTAFRESAARELHTIVGAE